VEEEPKDDKRLIYPGCWPYYRYEYVDSSIALNVRH